MLHGSRSVFSVKHIFNYLLIWIGIRLESPIRRRYFNFWNLERSRYWESMMVLHTHTHTHTHTMPLPRILLLKLPHAECFTLKFTPREGSLLKPPLGFLESYRRIYNIYKGYLKMKTIPGIFLANPPPWGSGHTFAGESLGTHKQTIITQFVPVPIT